MSVYDENRRKCNRCGKMVNHWEDNDCDKGLCKKTNALGQIVSVYGFKTEVINDSCDIDEPALQKPSEEGDNNTVYNKASYPCARCMANPCKCKEIEAEEYNRRNNQMSVLLNDSSKIIESAIAEYIKNEECSKLFEQIDFAKALVITANYIGGVMKA